MPAGGISPFAWTAVGYCRQSKQQRTPRRYRFAMVLRLMAVNRQLIMFELRLIVAGRPVRQPDRLA
jgi:hypothetical protein